MSLAHSRSLGSPALTEARSVPGGIELELHVVPNERTGTWRVQEPGSHVPASEHTDVSGAASAAERFARERPQVDGIVVHDRYHRAHWLPVDSRRGHGRRP